MRQDEANVLRALNEEQQAEFPIGCSVMCRFMPGSEGTVIEHDQIGFLLIGPRFKVRWTRHKYLDPGQTVDSDWLSYSELRALTRSQRLTAAGFTRRPSGKTAGGLMLE